MRKEKKHILQDCMFATPRFWIRGFSVKILILYEFWFFKNNYSIATTEETRWL